MPADLTREDIAAGVRLEGGIGGLLADPGVEIIAATPEWCALSSARAPWVVAPDAPDWKDRAIRLDCWGPGDACDKGAAALGLDVDDVFALPLSEWESRGYPEPGAALARGRWG